MGLLDSLFSDPAEPNKRLEGLMAELARSGAPGESAPETRRAFYRALSSASLRLASPGAIASNRLPTGRSVSDGTTQIPFVAQKDAQGNKIMLAFTGDRALLAWREGGCDTVELKVPDLCRLALDAGVAMIAINPRGPAGGLLRREEIQALAEGREP